MVDPIYRALVAFPVACFTLTVVTDFLYMQTSNLLWLHFSEWLLLAGLVFGIVATIYLGIRLMVARTSPPLAYGFAGLVVLLLAAINSFVHTSDGWTAVVPYGLTLSIATVLVMALTGIFGMRGVRHA